MKHFSSSLAPLLGITALAISLTSTTPSFAKARPKAAPRFSSAVQGTRGVTAKAAKTATARAASTRKTAWLPATLVIPKLKVDAPIVRGVDDAALRLGVGFDPSSDAAGVSGNCVIAGHRNVWGAWFWHLPKLSKGDLVHIDARGKRLTYRVEFARVVQPHETHVLEAPPKKAAPRLTLYTCTKPKTECRFIVVANLVKTPATKAAPMPAPKARPKPAASTRRAAPAKPAPTPREAIEVFEDGVIILD